MAKKPILIENIKELSQFQLKDMWESGVNIFKNIILHLLSNSQPSESSRARDF